MVIVTREDVIESKPEFRELEKESQEKFFKENDPDFYAVMKEVERQNANNEKTTESDS